MKPSLKKLLYVTVLTVGLMSTTSVQGHTEMTPTNSEAKTYMDYRTITNHKSPQWVLQLGATTNEVGLRTYNGRYCIAVGQGYTKTVGTAIDVELSTGAILPCIVGDLKQNQHTMNGKQCSNGNIVEFIVETDKLPIEARRGNISKIPGFEGYVKSLNIHEDSLVIPDQQEAEVSESNNEITNDAETSDVIESDSLSIVGESDDVMTITKDTDDSDMLDEDKSLIDLFTNDETEEADYLTFERTEDEDEKEDEVIDSDVQEN